MEILYQTTKPVRLILAYKNFAASTAISHIGLGVSALNTAKTLRREGIATEVWAIDAAPHLEARLKATPGVTHLVMSAPWITALQWQELCIRFPHIRFCVSSHSNVGFLQADPIAVQFMAEHGPALEQGFLNFSLAANSIELCRFLKAGYNASCALLPNLYFLTGNERNHRPVFSGGTLRVGSFGAIRVQKNTMSAAAAAIELASRLRVNLEFYVSQGRREGGNINSIRDLIRACKFAKFVEVPWEMWPNFRRTVAHMHLMMQPSYTETFNVVTADGVAEGVASVVSTAIEWAPEDWKADSDDVADLAKAARYLLHDPDAPTDGLEALKVYVTDGICRWKDFLRQTLMP